MRNITFAAALFVLSAAAAEPVPVLLELFTSEGCSSCPPADRLLALLDQNQPVPGAELIVLSEHVDYWNHQGWTDPFSSVAFTARQQEYTSQYGMDGVYTPQLVVDGTFGLVGSDGRAAETAIRKAIRETKIPITLSVLAREGNRVTARVEIPGSGQTRRGGHAVLYVALADNRAESAVARGENAGRLLAHVDVARVLKQAGEIQLGPASTGEVALTVPPGVGANGSHLVAFLQDTRSGRVLAVAARKL